MVPGHILRCIERLKTNEALRFDELYDCTSPVAAWVVAPGDLSAPHSGALMESLPRVALGVDKPPNKLGES